VLNIKLVNFKRNKIGKEDKKKEKKEEFYKHKKSCLKYKQYMPKWHKFPTCSKCYGASKGDKKEKRKKLQKKKKLRNFKFHASNVEKLDIQPRSVHYQATSNKFLLENLLKNLLRRKFQRWMRFSS
jgi:hypothetical protein